MPAIAVIIGAVIALLLTLGLIRGGDLVYWRLTGEPFMPATLPKDVGQAIGDVVGGAVGGAAKEAGKQVPWLPIAAVGLIALFLLRGR